MTILSIIFKQDNNYRYTACISINNYGNYQCLAAFPTNCGPSDSAAYPATCIDANRLLSVSNTQKYLK